MAQQPGRRPSQAQRDQPAQQTDARRLAEKLDQDQKCAQEQIRATSVEAPLAVVQFERLLVQACVADGESSCDNSTPFLRFRDQLTERSEQMGKQTFLEEKSYHSQRSRCWMAQISEHR